MYTLTSYTDDILLSISDFELISLLKILLSTWSIWFLLWSLNFNFKGHPNPWEVGNRMKELLFKFVQALMTLIDVRVLCRLEI